MRQIDMRHLKKNGLFWVAATIICATSPAWPAGAQGQNAHTYDWYACADEARRLEIQENIPKLLLTAVTFTETGRRGPTGREIMSWPWTLHADGKSLLFKTKKDAATAVRALMARGVKSIDVGCMQVNLRYHPHAFTSVEEALDPAANLAYGLAYLMELKKRHNGWPAAIQHYHSANRTVNVRYRSKVLATWDQLRRRNERERLRNGTSMSTRSEYRNELNVSAPSTGKSGMRALAWRENRQPWTFETGAVAATQLSWRTALAPPPFRPLPFKTLRPHARVLVALAPWTDVETIAKRLAKPPKIREKLKNRDFAVTIAAANQLAE